MNIYDKHIRQTEFNKIGNEFLPTGMGGTVGHGIGMFLNVHEHPPGTWLDFPI